MNWEEKIRYLAARARQETPPDVNVAPKVLRILVSSRAQPVAASERLWMWLAAVSSAVAVPTAVFALTTYLTSSEPLLEISNAISWVMQ